MCFAGNGNFNLPTNPKRTGKNPFDEFLQDADWKAICFEDKLDIFMKELSLPKLWCLKNKVHERKWFCCFLLCKYCILFMIMLCMYLWRIARKKWTVNISFKATSLLYWCMTELFCTDICYLCYTTYFNQNLIEESNISRERNVLLLFSFPPQIVKNSKYKIGIFVI